MNKILIYNSGGGLGDSLQIIPLLLSLKNYLIKPELFYSKNDLTYFEYLTARKPDSISLKKFLK